MKDTFYRKVCEIMLIITFSHPIIEKSDSAVTVLGNAEANPLQKLWSDVKQLFVGSQSSLKSIDMASFSVISVGFLKSFFFMKSILKFTEFLTDSFQA
jgi:hypothetical protein